MHIIETGDGKFIVRKFSFPLWGYVGKDGYVWHSWEYVRKYCTVDTEEEAREIVKKRTIVRKIAL
jgi:C1A family cysteine protease